MSGKSMNRERAGITKKEAGFAFLFSLLTAAALLLICTKSSVLYPFNDWVDANCYFSVGKSMMNGKVLYRDIYDHKGPLLYTLHAFAWLISRDTFFGVFLFEIGSFSLYLLSAYYILRLYVGKIALPALPVLGALLLSAMSFSHGDSAEEFCLPLLSWSLYGLLNYFKNRYPERIDRRELVLHGILAGCVLWIKFTMLGFHFAWMVILLLVSISRKDWKAFWMDGLTFLGGMLAATIPWIVYFGWHHALWDWIGGYIYNNVFVYTVEDQVNLFTTLKSIVRNTAITFLENGQYAVLTVIGMFWFWFGDKKPALQKIGMALLAVLTAVGTYWGTQAYYHYYGFILGVFAVLVAAPLLGMLEKVLRHHGKMDADRRPRRAAKVLIGAVCLAAGVLFSYLRSPNVYLLGFPKEEMVQYKFKKVIEETENPTLLNYGFLDGGFYTVCNIVPTCKYFAKFNIPLDEIYQSQEDLILYGQVDYVVTRNFELDEMYKRYELAAQDHFWFEGIDYQYYLYRLKK